MPNLTLSSVTVADRGVEISAEFSGVTAVVGPNGAGKSTLLGLVAGALRPDTGRILIGEDEIAAAGRFVPAHRRRVAYLEQRPLLFPHLNVLANAAFGATPEAGRAELAAVGCAEFAAKRPRELSGGQQQRVAIARALAIKPRVVCLDEPLAALDAAAVPEVRRVLRERLAGRTALIVTHDLLDVLSLADNLCVLEAGRVVKHGPTAELCARPTSAFLGELVGVNVLPGRWTGTCLDLGDASLFGMPEDVAPDAPALAAVAPNAWSLHTHAPGGSPRNALQGTVLALESRGGIVRVDVAIGRHRIGVDVTPAAVSDLHLSPGAPIVAAVKATQVSIYPAALGLEY